MTNGDDDDDEAVPIICDEDGLLAVVGSSWILDRAASKVSLMLIN